MNIGTLAAHFRDGKIVGFMGEVSLAGLGMFEIALAPRIEIRSENSPSHDLLVKSGTGFMPGGVAWTKKMVATGEPYFSMQFQFAGRDPVNVAAFPDDDDKGKADAGQPTEYTIVFSTGSGKARASSKGEAALAGDGVPF